MKQKRLLLLIACLVQTAISAWAQDDETVIYRTIKPKHSYTIGVALPATIANVGFKKLMQGVVNTGASYQYSLANGLSFGASYDYHLFSISKFQTPELITGGMHNHTTALKIAYEQFFSERIGMEYSLKGGYAWVSFYSDTLQARNGGPMHVEGLYAEPAVAFILSASANTAYKWRLAYSMNSLNFTPQHIGVESNLGFKPEVFKHLTQFISFGFCFTHYFKQRR